MRRALHLLLSVALVACAGPGRDTVAAPESAPVVELPPTRRPPAVRGGGLLVMASGRRAVVSDPDRDALAVVDLEGGLRLAGYVTLEDGDAPGRLAEDSGGRVHAVLRGGGAIATIDPDALTLLARREVCAAPRGIAWDPVAAHLLIACVGGDLVAMSEHGQQTVGELGPDLRDVVIDGTGKPWVTRFRTAELIDATNGHAIRIPSTRYPSPRYRDSVTAPYVARVAWRAAVANDQLWVAHQHHMERELRTPFTMYYGGFTNPTVVKPALTRFQEGQPPLRVRLQDVILPVDLAVSRRTGSVAVADGARPLIEIVDPGALDSRVTLPVGRGRAVAVAWVGERVLVHHREPAGLMLIHPNHADQTETLGLEAGGSPDVGHEPFHAPTRSEVACASCHPEAGDDGHVWNFAGDRRRTPTLAGGLLETAPFHWDGEHVELGGLMTAVFERRMGGRQISGDEATAIGRWLDAEPVTTASAPRSAGSAERGQALFEDRDVGCARCHAGPRTTDNRNHDVGTGGFFQTPTLHALRGRAPFFHDGCAVTLAERFGRCHTEGHGEIDGLDAGELRDLTAYLLTL